MGVLDIFFPLWYRNEKNQEDRVPVVRVSKGRFDSNNLGRRGAC